MYAYIIRRLILAVPVALGIITLVFLTLFMMPGDAAELLAGPEAPPEVVESIRTQLGLDRPMWEQYGRYLGRLVQGDLGRSLRNNDPVIDNVVKTFPATVELVVVGELISLMIGIPLGVVSAVRRKSWLDKMAMSTAVIGVSMPIFFIGLVLMLVFGFHFGWFPLGGRGGSLMTLRGWHYIALPAITLGIFHVAALARITRSSMLEVLAQDYVRTARAKGLPERKIVYKHALKNAMMPIVTMIGVHVAQIVGGAVVTETIYSWPGMGRLVVRSIFTRDFPVTQGLLLAIGLSIIFVNIAIDLWYAVLDPRVSYA